jgi:hypothetical protein
VGLILLSKDPISVLHIKVKPNINIFGNVGTGYRVAELDVTGLYSNEE